MKEQAYEMPFIRVADFPLINSFAVDAGFCFHGHSVKSCCFQNEWVSIPGQKLQVKTYKSNRELVRVNTHIDKQQGRRWFCFKKQTIFMQT